MSQLNIVNGHIDKLTIVGDMIRPRGQVPPLLDFLGNSYDSRIKGMYVVNKGQYSRNADIITHESTAKVELNDRKSHLSDFRIEFNPAKCNEDDMKFITHLLSMVKNKRCTRIDLCVNFHDDVMDYKLVDGRMRGQWEKTSANGRTETVYRGSDRSEDYIKFYDKKKQQKDVKYRDIEHDWCRVEETIQHKKAENFEDWEWFKGVKLVKDVPTFPEGTDPKDEGVAFAVHVGFKKLTDYKRAYRNKIQGILNSATYKDEFDIGEEIKKTSIVVETNEVLKKLLK